MTSKQIIGGSVAIVIAVLLYVGYQLSSNHGTFGSATACTDGYTCYTNVEVQGNLITDGTAIYNGVVQFLSSLQIGTNGTALTEIKSGTCTIFAYATTIAASTTAQVDCQAGASSLVAIAGIQNGDRVFANMASTTSAGFEGLTLQWVAASTTNGYINMKVYNGTGGTFTWAATASSSIPYVVFR